jgi:hypothetical protein
LPDALEQFVLSLQPDGSSYRRDDDDDGRHLYDAEVSSAFSR